MIEVTGSKNDIGLRKGQQLGQWVTDEEINLVEEGLDIPIVGVIIGNAFCETAPAARSADHFGPNLETYARRRAFKLVTTQEIFELVTNGGASGSRTVRTLLGVDTFAE